MIRLVVNADDAGIDSARNRGILWVYRKGGLSSASVLAGFPAAEEFLKASRARRFEEDRRLGIGLHLNLSEGRPLSSGHRTLVDGNGRFHGKPGLWRRALAGDLDPAEVRREAEAQWSWLVERGARPDHLDGHHHAHLLPGAAEALAGAVPEGTWVRLPREAPPAPDELRASPENLFEEPGRLAGALAELSRRAMETFGGRFRSAERFLGLRLLKGYTAAELIAALSPLLASALLASDGTVELMAHPGEVDAGSVGFSGRKERLDETLALTDPALRSALRERGVELSSFGEIP